MSLSAPLLPRLGNALRYRSAPRLSQAQSSKSGCCDCLGLRSLLSTSDSRTLCWPPSTARGLVCVGTAAQCVDVDAAGRRLLSLAIGKAGH